MTGDQRRRQWCVTCVRPRPADRLGATEGTRRTLAAVQTSTARTAAALGAALGAGNTLQSLKHTDNIAPMRDETILNLDNESNRVTSN